MAGLLGISALAVFVVSALVLAGALALHGARGDAVSAVLAMGIVMNVVPLLQLRPCG